MKRLTWTHFFFGFFGIVLSTGVFFFTPVIDHTSTHKNTRSVTEKTVALLLVQPKGETVNLREQPDLDSPIVGVVDQNAVFEITETCGETLTKVGQNGEWIKGRTADGTEGYTAAWLYEVVGVNNYTISTPSNGPSTTTVTTIQNEDMALSVCQGIAPAVLNASGSVTGSAAPDTTGATDVGTTDVSAFVAAGDGQTSRTAELSSDAPEIESATSSTADMPAGIESAGLLLKPTGQENINIRAAPVDGAIVGVVQPGSAVAVMEPVDQALSKIDTASGWIMVRTAEGAVGYTAAWLFDLASDPPAADTTAPVAADLITTTSGTALAVTNQIYLTPTTSLEVRVRAAPVDGAVVGAVAPESAVLVIEPRETALEKVGVAGEWIQVRTSDGIEGYTAAGLYTVVEPDESAAPAILPLDTTAEDDTGFLPVEEEAATYNPNSIAALNLVPSARPQDSSLEPLGISILDLNIPSPSSPATIPQPATIPIPKTESVSPQTSETSTDLGLVPAGSSSAAAPATESGDLIANPGNSTDAIISGEPENASFVEPVNNIIPITVEVTDKTEVATAEIAINDQPVARFYDAPYEFDLDASQLHAGDYRLTFTAVSTSDMLYADEMYFEIAVDDQTASALPVEGAAGTVTGTSSVPEQRVVMIDGEARPFTLDFSVAKGLVPTPVKTGENDSPKSLGAIWSRPFSSLIPGPIRTTLTAERPLVASIIILFMLVLLLPQGIFTLYWMTYTWNNPRAADDYRSPKEFLEPQYSFTALLPARREEHVIKDTIYAVDRINYPDHLKEILILIRDEDDDGTINAAREAIREIGKDNVRLVTFTDGPYNKPNGLNRGLKVATKDVVCIFDAEDEPHPDIYNVVNTVMVRDEADVVQSGVQLMNFKSTWFSAFNVLEYFLWFKSGLHAFTRQFGVTPLGGNTVFFKRHWLERIDGWDEGCLTEDGDIGIRLTTLGANIRIVYEAEHATQEETPDTAESFIKQRTRWCQGFYQIFLKGEWRTLPTLKQRIVALYILLNSLLQASMIVYIPIGLFIALTQHVPVPVAMISYVPIYVLVIQLIINLVSIREFTSAYGEKLPRFFSLKMVVFFYPYQLMLSISALRAVYRMFQGHNSWEKTAHSNLHRVPVSNQAGA